MTVEGLHIQTTGDTLEVVVDRGEENSFSGSMMDAFCDSVDQASHSGTMRFVHIRAEGPNFCVARDREGRAPDELRAEAIRIVRVNETCRTTPLTVVAEVQGPAAAFGAGLVATTDLAVASDAVTLSFPEILAGLARRHRLAGLRPARQGGVRDGGDRTQDERRGGSAMGAADRRRLRRRVGNENQGAPRGAARHVRGGPARDQAFQRSGARARPGGRRGCID
jgi:hypothetical protein